VIVAVVPCFDAERTVGDVVRGARAADLEVVAVDDGSTDATTAAATAAGATVLRHPANHGKGAALQTGFAWAARAGATAVVTLDADGQHDTGELPRVLAAHRAQPDALVIGVRSFAADGSMPRWSRIGNRVSTYWISKYARRPHADTQSGFRVYPRALFDGAPLRSRRFETESELLLIAARRGVPLVEVPIRTIYGPSRTTHFRGFADTLRIMRLVFLSPLWRSVDPIE
jgi:glycosyltransferase involved in cell wall biosynthesis